MKPAMTAKKTVRSNSKRVAAGKPGGVAIVGLGNVGTALACALKAAGYRVSELVVRRTATAGRKSLARSVGATLIQWKSWRETGAEVVWLTVADAEIAAVAAELARRWTSNYARPKLVLHASGSQSSAELAPLKKLGVRIGSAHPFRSFPQPVTSCARNAASLQGTWFGVEGDAAAVREAAKLVKAMGGRMFVLKAKDKALYHAFASLAAPLLVSLLTAAEEAGVKSGVPRATARELILKLSGGTFGNWSRNGPEQSFSGPISRGDAETIERHLASLSAVPEVEKIYRALAGYAVGHLPVKRRERMEAALRSKTK
jgi:predicted short-subunit dehydrogenase-like oxidoreductase (DUF2520 family)